MEKIRTKFKFIGREYFVKLFNTTLFISGTDASPIYHWEGQGSIWDTHVDSPIQYFYFTTEPTHKKIGIEDLLLLPAKHGSESDSDITLTDKNGTIDYLAQVILEETKKHEDQISPKIVISRLEEKELIDRGLAEDPTGQLVMKLP